MKSALLIQIVVITIVLQSSIIVSSLSFDGSHLRSELSSLIVLGPGLLLLSSFQGTFAEKSKRNKKNVQEQVVENEEEPTEPEEDDIKGEETSKTVANHVIQELKEKAKKVQAQNKLENNKQKKSPQNDDIGSSSKRKPSSPKDDAEMNPMKCFPKALCGVSSEVAQISKKQKNGLITDYLLLMRAIARNPTVVDEVARPSKKNTNDDEPQDDLEETNDDDNNSSGDEEEDEDEEDDEQDSGEGEEEDDDNESAQDDIGGDSYKKKKATKKSKPLSPDDADHEEYLKEKLAMDQLYKETLDHETWNDDNWWGVYGSDGDSVGNKNKRRRPSRFRSDKLGGTTSDSKPAPSGGVTSFFSNWFSFGSPSSSSAAYPGNRGFSENGRDSFPSSSEIVPGIGMDETKEILETAIEIGKGFDRPNQCNEIFNGCKYDYTDLLYMIDEMRHSLREKASKSSQGGKRKQGNKKAKTAVEVNQSPSSNEASSYSSGSKKKNSKSRYRVTPKGSRNKNKQIKKKRPSSKSADTEDRVVIPNSHEKLSQHHLHNRNPYNYDHHHHHPHHQSAHTGGQSGSDESSSSPGSSFSLTNMFSSWIG